MPSSRGMGLRLVLVFLLAASAQAVTIPAGTQLEVRLTSEVSSDRPSGQLVSGIVIAPVFLNDTLAISTGTLLTGNTADARAAKPANNQTTEQPAKLRIQFTQIEDQAGHSKPLHCTLVSVDNARESVDDSGLITGITASETFTARLDQGINKITGQYQPVAQILAAVKGALLSSANPSIDYTPGVELTVKLTKALEWSSAHDPMVGAVVPENALRNFVNSEPFRTTALRPPKPSDITNLMLIGTQEQLQTSFHEAGWVAADRLSGLSKFKTARAIIENRGYSEAPMSILVLDGREPDLALQKQNDTFAMRHHIRIWLRPHTFDGKSVWIAAATHDINISFSPETRSFTHGIDSEIDNERRKVVYDLLFTRRIHAFSLVDRTGIPQNASNATGDKLITDGKIAVLEF